MHKIVYMVATEEVSAFEEAFRDEIRWFRSAGCVPTIVMDGPKTGKDFPKAKTVEERRQAKQKHKDKAEALQQRALHTAVAEPERKALAQKAWQQTRMSLRPRSSHFSCATSLCREMGCPVVVARGEAEKLCVEMLPGAIITDDTDVLAMGCRNMLFRARSSRCELIRGDVILETLGWDQDQFRDFCIMCGTDVSDRIPNIGPKRALTILREKGSVSEAVQALRQRGKHPEEDLDRFEGTLPVARAFLTADGGGAEEGQAAACLRRGGEVASGQGEDR